MKIHEHDAGHMTKIAATLINGKKPSKIFLWNRWTDFLETWYVAIGTLIIGCSNDDPALTLTILGKVKFGYIGFSIGNNEKNGFFRTY